MIEHLTPPGRPKLPPEQIEALNTILTLMNDTKALAAVMRGFKDLGVAADKLKTNKIPTLALIGADDTLKKGVDELNGQMANLEIVVIDKTDHMTAFSSPEFTRSLRAFLAKHRGRTKAKEPAGATAK
jgi:pimeloyl-ACP methyl ester carboxylesterase